MSSTERRILPADVYDALELSALVYGGIGAGRFTAAGTPCCIVGHSVAIAPCGTDGGGEVADAFFHAFGTTLPILLNDGAVEAVNMRNGVFPRIARIPFAAWCKELGVERGA